MNIPHRHLEQLLHPNHAELPLPINHFATATTLCTDVWTDLEKVGSNLGHKADYTETLVSSVQIKLDYLHFWQ